MLRQQKVTPRPNKNKATLDIYRVPVFRIHYQKLEAFIQQEYGFEFDFLLLSGVTEGICPEYAVTGKLDTVDWQRRAQDLRAGKRTRSTLLILNTLAHDGRIPRGHYTVSTHEQQTPADRYREILRRTGDTTHPDCVGFKMSAGPSFVGQATVIERHWSTLQ